jgi:hypothetical protein
MLVVDLLTKDVHDNGADTKQGTQRGSRRCSHGTVWIDAAPKWRTASRRPQAQLADMDEKSDINALTSRTPVEAERQASMAARSQSAAANWSSVEGGGE